MIVDLPPPEGPTNATVCPGISSNDNPCNIEVTLYIRLQEPYLTGIIMIINNQFELTFTQILP